MVKNLFKIDEKIKELFWKKVKKGKKNECWNWGGKLNRGYGWQVIEGKGHRAHRVAYVINKGKIPKEMLVLHKCDNRACVNPNHLFLGNYDINNKDRAIKGRSSRGEDRPAHKLTENQVREIRRISNNFSGNELAKMFGVSKTNIHIIIHLKGWKHIK